MSKNVQSSLNDGEHSGDGKKISKSRRKSPGAFLTISEVAEDLNVPQHVLRFWETKFAQIRPLKRGGGRRYYRPEDVKVVKQIYHLLYTDGYTIKGVQKLLRGQGKSQIVRGEFSGRITPVKDDGQGSDPGLSSAVTQKDTPISTPMRDTPRLSQRQKTILKSMLGELKDLRDMIVAEDQKSEEET